MKYVLGDKVIYSKDKTKFSIIVNAIEDYDISGIRPVYQLSQYGDAWFDECDLEYYSEKEFNKRIDEYNLAFADVLNEIFSTNGWYQGINFNEYSFIAIGRDGKLVEKYFVNSNGKTAIKRTLEIDARIAKMKYKRIK